MNSTLRTTLESQLATHLEMPVEIVGTQSVSGGCIHQTWQLRTSPGTTFFVKVNQGRCLEMFQREAEGLDALAAGRQVRVPRVLSAGTTPDDQQAYLLMEWIEPGRPRTDSSHQLGAALAGLHQQATSSRFGFASDNYLGETPQPNTWDVDWVHFWREQRLGYQFRLAREDGHADREFQRLAQRVLDRTADWIAAPDEPPTLLHGDLWSGNYLWDQQGQGVLIDPAVYYGRREAELAMTRLFGGFDRDFYEGYRATWPLADGAEERIAFYQLYHVLNHLHLFGTSYYGQALSLMRRFADR